MAVHFDAVSQGYANATSVTWSHTCTGSDRFLVVGIKLYVPDDITSVTYHGDALTLIGEEVLPAEGSFVKFYGLTAPDTGGSYDVVITRTSANHIVATAASYTGVKQTGQPEAFAAVDNASATDTLYLPVTVTTSGAWLVGVGTGVYSGAAFTGGTAATVVRKDNDLAVVGIECAADSGGPVAPGTRQLTLFRSGSFQSYAGVVAVLAPVTASTGHGVDNFNRADGGLGTNWTTLWDNSGSGAGHQIISNQVGLAAMSTATQSGTRTPSILTITHKWCRSTRTPTLALPCVFKLRRGCTAMGISGCCISGVTVGCSRLMAGP